MNAINAHRIILRETSDFFTFKHVSNADSSKREIVGVSLDGKESIQAICFDGSKYDQLAIDSFLSSSPNLKPLRVEYAKRTDNMDGAVDCFSHFDLSVIQSVKRDENGFVTVKAPVTRVGIFKYLNHDGSTRLEFRPPEEVFNQDSYKSLALKPVTNDHPADMLNSKNAGKHIVGSTGDLIVREDVDGVPTLVASFSVIDAQTIAELDAGKRELSCGYDCELEYTPGEYQGQKYDCIQRNIRYNHLAIVAKGRAGSIASINMDGQSENNSNKEKPVVKIRIDTVEYEVPAEVARDIEKNAEALETAQGEVKDLTAQVATVEGERDAQKDRADKAEKIDILPLVSARIALMRKADSILGVEETAKLDKASDLDVMKACIVKLSPEAKFDGKSPEYIAARFDSSIEITGVDAIASQRQETMDGCAANVGGGDSRKKMMDEKADAWKKKPAVA